VIIANNVGNSPRDTTADQQQHHILLAIICQNSLQISLHPHDSLFRPAIMDEHLLQEGHEIILAMDANEMYNPDIPTPAHHLNYLPSNLTFDKHHDGKLSTLVASCALIDPLALQHHSSLMTISRILL
jgi:hypothetical protein